MELRWPLADRLDLRDRLVAAYSTERGYHDLRHLAEVLTRITELGEDHNAEVVLAAWFHDAVYDGRPGAEERSAALAQSELVGTEVDVDEVARLVRLTERHDPAPDDRPGAVLCDADLAILAADDERYREYADGVRADVAAVPDPDFRAGRRAVLEALAARDPLYGTAYAREHWEARARANLARELASLG